MRKGNLSIKQAKKFKTGDVYFDTEAKITVTVKAIEDGVVIGETSHDQPCRVHPESLVELTVKDVISEEEFELDKDQWGYMYKTCRESDFKFYTRIDQIKKQQVAVIFAKNADMLSLVRVIEPVVNAYGAYVASQKAIGEPAKNFSDWYFYVSV